MHLIDITHITFSYPVAGKSNVDHPPVLDDISLFINKGEYIAIAGANGSGKSTFIRQLNGLLLPTSGNVTYNGLSTHDPSSLPVIRQNVGIIFQEPENQIVGTTVETDIAFALENMGVPRTQMSEKINSVLDITGLKGFNKRQTLQLSNGEQQRLAIAAIIAMDPDVFIFDEATSMIEPSGRAKILEILKKLHNAGKTVITVTHEMEEILEAERVLLFNKGRVVADTDPNTFFNKGDLTDYSLTYPDAWNMLRKLNITSDITPVGSLSFDSVVKTVKQYTDIDSITSPPVVSNSIFERTEETDKAVSFTDCSYSYHSNSKDAIKAIEDINLDIFKGRITAFLGTTGSGKSTLGRDLSNRLNLPAIELDALFWQQPDWQKPDKDVFRERVRQALSSDNWVIDGNYSAVREIVWRRADTLIWLDYPYYVIYPRLFLRTIKRARTRENLWNSGNHESLRAQFLSRDSLFLWAIKSKRKQRRVYPDVLEKPEYQHLQVHTFRNPSQTARWLATITQDEDGDR